MNRLLKTVTIVASSGMFLQTGKANAVVLPDPLALIQLQINNTIQQTTTFDSEALGSNDLTAAGSVTLGALPGTPPSMSASVHATGGNLAEAYVYEAYYFQVAGPDNATAKVNIAGSGSISPTLSASNIYQQSYVIFGGNYFPNVTLGAAGYGAGNNSSFSFDTTEMLTTNTQYEIQMRIVLYAASYISDSASASIDPYISFAPNFDSTGLSLEFSPGIENVAGVPELSTWAMVILGFAGVGFMACRPRSKPTLIAA